MSLVRTHLGHARSRLLLPAVLAQTQSLSYDSGGPSPRGLRDGGRPMPGSGRVRAFVFPSTGACLRHSSASRFVRCGQTVSRVHDQTRTRSPGSESQ